jgi:sec-independent protein translocase protein TatA
MSSPGGPSRLGAALPHFGVRQSGRPTTIGRGNAIFENIGGAELLVVALVIFVFFGPKQLPEIGKKLGRGMKEFKDAKRGIQKKYRGVNQDLIW